MKTKINLIALSLLVAMLGYFTVSCATNSSSAGTKPYPLEECIVTGNELGSMGDPITIVHEGQEVKFCCKPCVSKFKANPQKYLAKLS